MAYYQSDPDLNEAEKIYKEAPQTERERVLMHALTKYKVWLLDAQKINIKYADFFQQLKNFLPDNHMTLR